MTIKEYVTSKKEMGVNEWIKQIALDGLEKHQSMILKCADDHKLITIDNSTTFMDDFINSINI